MSNALIRNLKKDPNVFILKITSMNENDFCVIDIKNAPEIDEYVKKARAILSGVNYLYGTADYCLAGYLRIKEMHEEFCKLSAK